MIEALDLALAYLIENEGSKFVNDPDDSGGPTKFGVTLKAWAHYKKLEIVVPEDIAALTVDDVKPFYRDLFWLPLYCGSMKDPRIATAIFDTAVLYGNIYAAAFAQQALALCNEFCQVDGHIGTYTLRCLNRVPRGEFLMALRECITHRINDICRKNPKNEKYRAGWTNRAKRLLTLV